MNLHDFNQRFWEVEYKFDELPCDFFLEIEGDAYRVGKLTVNKDHNGYSVDVAIVQRESKKIWKHVTQIFGESDPQEALDNGVFALSTFLKGS